ncbi:vacuolar fusion protein CCZ1 homolog isoform X2 [Zootermopsis nevadensis]|uniref:vacuolar fusion protein CCZ1 homolog isoform X2 n=1 Tax=Zootermopsis nevadensis TaxID=136037 RepID=UPI000B8ED801|nr:vacuolar fusion protein CCZ1 homolog isoform X2 [Zootermopsis nevadensis]
MTSKSEINLQNFYVYNSAFGQSDGEEDKKILFYYPPKTDFDTQMKNVGLSEAIVKFTDTFSSDQLCEALHTQKSRQLYYQAEGGFWMTVGIPFVTKVKDGTEYFEYQSDDVQDNVYLAVLRQSYQMFRLFKGSFTSILSNSRGDVIHLKHKLDHFFSRYLLTLKLNHSDILDIFQGIQFLPLDKQTFLHVQCFVNLIEATFAQVKYTAFLYNDQLVWSGLEPEDMQVVYRYLVTSLLPAHLETELQGGSMPRHPSSPFLSSHYGRFVTGPANLQDASGGTGKVPKVYVNNDATPEIYHLVVYRALSATVCLFIEGSLHLNLDLFKRLDIFLGPQLTTLVSEVAEQCGRQAAGINANSLDPSPKFVYFNKLNLAQKSTVHLDSRRTGNVAVTPEVLRLLADINADKARMSTTGETILKTMTDYWVVGKVSNLREFYVVIHQKNANLIEINDEVKRLSDSQLKSIFFHD